MGTMPGRDYPRPRIRINRAKLAKRARWFWLAVPHGRQPYLDLSGKPIGSGVLKDACRRCGRGPGP